MSIPELQPGGLSMQETSQNQPDEGALTKGDLEEGELYVFRKGHLEHIARDEEEGMRRVRITEEAYLSAMEVGKQMRSQLSGYKPDVSLVISAILVHAVRDRTFAQRCVKDFVVKLFSQAAN